MLAVMFIVTVHKMDIKHAISFQYLHKIYLKVHVSDRLHVLTLQLFRHITHNQYML